MLRITPLLILCLLPVAASAQSLTPTVVARVGQSAPGAGGETFTSFQVLPRLGTNGHVAFEASLSGASATNLGFWAGTPGNLQLAIRKNSAIVDGVVNWSSTVNLGVDANGYVSMWTAVNNLSTLDNRMWSYLPDGNGGNVLVAAEGTTAPPGFTGAVFSNIAAGQASNDSGTVAFVAAATGGDATFSSDQALFTGTPGNLTLVAREGSTATGAAGPAPVFSTSSTPFYDKRINASGQVAFGAALSGVAVGADRAIYVWSPGGASGTLNLAAQTGSTAPGLGSSTIKFSVVDDSPGFNDAGEVAFRGQVIGDPGDGVTLTNNFGIWAGAPGNVQLIARSGSPSPIPGIQYRAPDQYPRMNDAGDVAFITLLGPSVPSTSDRALWLSTSTGVELVAREGSPAPGASIDNSVLFNALEAAAPAINNAGQVAFTATLVLGGSVTSANDRGLWAGAPDNVSLVAREGDVIDLDSGPGELLRTIQSFSFANGFSVSGGTNFASADAAFNDAGQIAWQAQFTAASGGGTAVFLTTLPSIPSTLDGDYNDDDIVDAADYVVWRKHEGSMTMLPNDPHGGTIGPDQYDTWVEHFGETIGNGGAATATTVPEPAAITLVLLIAAVGLLLPRRGVA